jgi:hypothetical protein
MLNLENRARSADRTYRGVIRAADKTVTNTDPCQLNKYVVNSLKGTFQQKLTGDVSYINRGLPFALNTWYFIFKFKGNLLFKLKKNWFQRHK